MGCPPRLLVPFVSRAGERGCLVWDGLPPYKVCCCLLALAGADEFWLAARASTSRLLLVWGARANLFAGCRHP